MSINEDFMELAIGLCNCNTKTPKVRYHDKTCPYKNMMGEFLENLLADTLQKEIWKEIEKETGLTQKDYDDMLTKELKRLANTEPSSPNVNDRWIDSDTNTLKIWNGSEWVEEESNGAKNE